MGDRLDLSGFTPTFADRPRTPDAEAVERGVLLAGSGLWTYAREPDQVLTAAADLQPLRSALRRQAGAGASFALVDWTSLHRARQLLEEPASIRDPFTALADFGAVVAALLFYDKVLVVPETDGAEQALGASNLIRPLTTTFPGVGQDVFNDLLDRHYHWARDRLEGASQRLLKPAWYTALAQRWEELLPGVGFPPHERGKWEDPTFQTSPMRGDNRAVLFQRESVWTWRNDLHEVILDNDLRSLFYERLAATLQELLRDGDEEPTVQYLGGCLRTPLLLARAAATEAALLPSRTPENWLESSWQRLYQAQSRDVVAPFWLQAVLAGSRERGEIASKLAGLRKAARAYRRHRHELAQAVTRGDQPVLQAAQQALAGDLQSLNKAVQTAAGAGVDVVKTTVKLAAPVVPDELIGVAARAAGAQSGWLNRLAVRLFRPRLWILVEAGSLAERGTDILPHAARLFGFAGLDATEPRNFLTRVGRTTWIA